MGFRASYQAEYDEVLRAFVALSECPFCHRKTGWHTNGCQAPDSPDRRTRSMPTDGRAPLPQ
jgi:hypothetical protein